MKKTCLFGLLIISYLVGEIWSSSTAHSEFDALKAVQNLLKGSARTVNYISLKPLIDVFQSQKQILNEDFCNEKLFKKSAEKPVHLPVQPPTKNNNVLGSILGKFRSIEEKPHKEPEPEPESLNYRTDFAELNGKQLRVFDEIIDHLSQKYEEKKQKGYQTAGDGLLQLLITPLCGPNWDSTEQQHFVAFMDSIVKKKLAAAAAAYLSFPVPQLPK